MQYNMEEKYNLIKDKLLKSEEKDPIKIVKSIMHNEAISIHGPEHHFLDGRALLAAIKNNGLDIDLKYCLDELSKRSIKMPGAMCGYWGMCGSVGSIGAVFSILDETGPLSSDIAYSNHMKFTSKVIRQMGEIGGPRCCKRNAFLSISNGIRYANENYGLNIPLSKITCEFYTLNKQCIKEKCPFYDDKSKTF